MSEPLPPAQIGQIAIPMRDLECPVGMLANHELWMAFCRDSEGDTPALMSEVR